MFLLDIVLWALSFGTLSVIQGEDIRAEDPDEQGLLERASRADPEALGALYDRYVGRIYSYIYHRVGQADLAEDLTAQVFARMLEAIREGRAWRTSFSGWLYRIAHNLVANHHRNRARWKETSLDQLEIQGKAIERPEPTVEASERRRALLSALRRQPEERQRLVILKFTERLSNEEIGHLMGRTESSIKSLYFRTLRALRADLEARGW